MTDQRSVYVLNNSAAAPGEPKPFNCREYNQPSYITNATLALRSLRKLGELRKRKTKPPSKGAEVGKTERKKIKSREKERGGKGERERQQNIVVVLV